MGFHSHRVDCCPSRAMQSNAGCYSPRRKRRQMGAAARKRMETWSPREYVDGIVEAVELAARSRQRQGKKRPA